MNRHFLLSAFCFLLLPLIGGCFGSRTANIELRKEAAKARQRIAELEAQHRADEQRMLALERSATTIPVLPNERLGKLFTAHGLSFNRLTGGACSKEDLGYHDLVKVYVCPTDQEGQALKAAGSFKVSIFDLSNAKDPLIASREFSTTDAMKAWYGKAMLYNYVLEVPLRRPPQQPSVTVSVSFTDELTRRQITADHKVKL